ncbi:DUF456 domain-containing protein [Chishuiella changwenlii]|jgi:uncharacterized protein YqgC (DUF456 family)|uniref:DUF456 domain-containing protein n=1 Tax=Chishuiella changwenlii TaxID=1434701 RepID=UPI002FDAC048
MDSNVILHLITGILLIIGLIGTILPVVPGAPIAYLGLIVFKFSDDCTYGWLTIIITGIFVLIGFLLDYLLPSYFTKKLGGTKYGVWGSILGLIVGLFFPPIGFIIGPFLGAFLGELLFSKSNTKSALKSAFGSFVGFMVTTGYDIILVLIFIGIFVYQLV